MSTPSAFSDLGESQLHYLKSQYLAALQMVDQTEAVLKAQLAEAAKARKQLEEQMQHIDQQLDAASAPKQPATPAKPTTKPKPRSRPRTRGAPLPPERG